MPGYTSDLYNYIVGLDPTFKNDVSLEQFKSKMSDTGYSKNMYDWVGQSDKTFHSDVSFDAFREKLGYKKKETTVSRSVQKQAPISSGTQPKVIQKPSATSVSQKDKDREGFYTLESKDAKVYTGLPGKEKTQYRVLNNKWQRRDESGWRDLDSKNSIDLLNTYFNKTVKSREDITKGLESNVKKAELEKELSDKELASVLGWSEQEVKKSKAGSGSPDKDFKAAMVKPDMVKPSESNAIGTMAVSTQKAYSDLGPNASSEDIKKKTKYYDTVESQKYLKSIGYDIDVNGDESDEKTKIALNKEKVKQDVITKDAFKAADTYESIDNEINQDLLLNNEEFVVTELRKKYSKDGFYFEETGAGDSMIVKYSPIEGVETRQIEIPLNTNDINNVNTLRDFMKQSYMTASERKNLNSEELDIRTQEGRDTHIDKLLKLMADNPYKYGTSLLSEDEIENHINNSYSNLKEESKNLQQEYKDLQYRIDKFNQDPSNPQEKAFINNKIHELSQKELQINNRYNDLSSVDKSINKVASINYDKSKQPGNWIGVLGSQFVQGITNPEKTLTQLSMDVLPYAVGEDVVDPITRQKLKDKGYTDTQILDYASKELKNNLYENLKEGITNVSSLGTTTSDYVNSKDRNDLLKAASFLAESIGTSLSAGGNPTLQKVAFFTQSYNAMEEQMVGPEFDSLNEWQKKLISVPYGFVIGALERYGIAALGEGANPIVNRFATAIVNKTMLSLPKDATVDTIKREINKSVGAMIAQGALKVAGGSLVEGGTEATQQLFEIGEKFLVNKIVGSDKEPGFEYFKDVPDITTADGLKKAFEIAGTDFYYGALGGLLMSGGVNAYQTTKQNSFNKKTDQEFEAFYDSMTDDKLRKLNVLNTKIKLKNGEITKQEAKETIDAINSSSQKLKSLNLNLSLRDKKDAFNLMLQRDKLEQEKAPLDEAMQAPYNERITNINNELKTISENAIKESNIEEVTAEGGGLQREGAQEGQPQVGQGEGPVGETTQPETDLGNRPVEGRGIQEEGVTRDVINRPSTLSEFGGNTFDTPLQGDTYVDGQQVVFEDRATGRIYELGNIDEVMDSSIPGLQAQEETISITPEGKVSIEGNNWNIQSELPTQGIEYNPAGEVTRVSLKDDAGNTQMFEGQQAVDIAYQIELQKIQSTEQQQFINDLLEQDEEFQTATESIKPRQIEAVVQEEAATDTVQAEPTVAEKVVIDKPVIITNTTAEVERVKSLSFEAEDGATFNIDGTKYEGVGLVVPVDSMNTTTEELTPEMVADFVAERQKMIGDAGVVKAGIYKFPNSNQVSIDLSVVVPETSREQAIEFGRLADQESLFDLGTFENVKTGGTGKNPMKFTPEQHREIAKALKEGRLPNVFEQTTETTVEQEVEAIGQLFSGTDEQIDQKASKIINKKIAKAVARAAKAVSKIIPGTKFIVHDTDESYRAATKEEGLKQSSNGEFNAKTNTIHINGTSANARTVAHEVFHAILINKVKTDANAAAITKRMVQAIASKIDNNPELKKKLDNFLSNYEENIQNEEKLAELVGMLAENYNSMSASIKDIIARWIDKLANIFGLDPFNRNETYDMLNTIARKVAKGKVIKEADVKIIEDVDNGESFESQYVSANGTVVITPSNRKSKVVGTVVSESDLIDPKTLVGKPLEVFYYDNLTSSSYELKNRISGSTIKRVGEGGPGYSYRPEIKKAGIIAAFTNVTKVLNSIQGIKSRNDIAKESAVVGVALQNKETGHLGNKTTEKDFYSPSEGVIAQAINDELLTENEAVEMLRGAVDAYAATSKGSDPKSSLGFTSNDFSTLDDFYKKIGAVSFERRGTFNAIAIPSKADLKITKATKPYVVTWLNSGIPTLKEYFNATTEQYTKEAEAHDIVKYLDPALDKIGVDGSVTISEAEKNRAKSMGVEIVTISNDLIHTSYPVVMFGKNIGVPTTFHSVRDMSKDWDVPNPFFKAGRRSNKATPIIIPEIKANEKKPATTRKQLSPEVSSKLTEDKKGNFVFHHYSKEKRGVIKPGAGQNIITGNEEGGALSAVGGLAMYYTMDNQVEPGVGNVLHTVLVPRDKVYDFNKDPDNFYDEAKKRFEAARPSQSFGNPNYQLAFVTQVANENGYDMVVAKWRNNELRANTTMSLEPSKDNVPMKPITEETYKVGDDVEVYGSKAKITSIDGDIISYKGEGVSGGINFKRFPKNISKQITPRKQIAEEVTGIEETIDPRKQKADTISGMVFTARQNGFSDAAISQYLLGKGYTQEQIDSALSAKAGTKNIDDIFEASEQEIKDKLKRKSIREYLRSLGRTLFNRQVDIKRVLNTIALERGGWRKGWRIIEKNNAASRAFDKLVNKAGATGQAAIRFKIAAKDIYGKLKEADIKILDRIIYARRIISINENRAMKGLEPYRGMSGYSEVNAQQDLNDIKNEIGEEKFNDLNERAGKYFDVFKENLNKLKESGRITEEVYNDLSEIEYSPIATIKYIISDNMDVSDMDREAARLGMSKDDIKKLTDRNENGIITDSRYLLAMNISSVESRAFENAMLNEVVKALDEATPEQQVALSEYIVFDNPIVGSFKDGRPKRKYDDQAVPSGFKKVYYFNNGIENYIIAREDVAKQLLDVKNSKMQASIENVSKTVPVIGWALKTITLTPARLLRFFATGGNPTFIIKNIAVDWPNAVFNTDVYSKFKTYGLIQSGFGFVKNFIKKAVTDDTFNKIYREFAEHGGLMDFLSNESMRSLNELKPGHKIFSKGHRVLEIYGNIMSFFGETSEVAMRLAVYEKMKSNLISEFKKENGADPNAQQMDDIMWRAAREARELIDFNQGGSWAKEADVIMPYLNAALQGFRKPIEYAVKNPIGFASSYFQLALMGSSIAGMSLGAAMVALPDDDDDEEKKRKIRKALDSISDHEKASYHIIFTGKMNKDGELEYIRIKKLPIASIATTYAEQLMYDHLVDYKFNEATFNEAIEKSLPFSISELRSKNPVISGYLTYKYNEDTFTGEKVFRGPKDKVILETAEGVNDPKIEAFYKSVAPALGLSPARSKAFVEKIITSQSTNPTINIFYAAANGMFGKDTQFGTEFSTGMEKLKEASGKALIRYTNENVIKYKKEDELEKQKVYITTDKYLKDSKIKADIKSRYNEGKTMTVGELVKIVKENYEPIDQERYFNKYYTYTQTMNTNPALLDLLYEDDPNIQALMINDMYGPNLDKEEMNELGEVMNKSRIKVSDKTWYIYQNKYKNRK
jgi:hypothetical protein